MRILGLDTATVRLGYGVIEATPRGVVYVDCGVLSAPASWPRWRRLAELHADLVALVAEVRPDRAAIEGGVDKYPSAALAGGESRGIALAALFAGGVSWEDVAEIAPTKAKAAATGSGRADKPKVARLVCLRLGLATMPTLDATDALAIALAAVGHQGRPPTSDR